jgi:soluble lytic murein transglycosylase-like protein
MSIETEEKKEAGTFSERSWRALALNGLAILVVVNGALALYAFREVVSLREEIRHSVWRSEQRYQRLNADLSFASNRRRLLLGIRDEVMKIRPQLGITGAYEVASLVIDATDKYPSVDPLLLVSVGIVESQYDGSAVSSAGARGLYQIHPTTGRLLARAMGREYSDELLHDPRTNTEMAALYLDLLQTVYNDTGLVLAEYNGGPLNAGYFRARVRALSTETKDYVPRVLGVYQRLARELGAHRPENAAPVLSAARLGDLLRSSSTAVQPAMVATGGE